MYELHEQVGNFSQLVMSSDVWYDIQDYLSETVHYRVMEELEFNGIEITNDEEYSMEYEHQMSYFTVIEK